MTRTNTRKIPRTLAIIFTMILLYACQKEPEPQLVVLSLPTLEVDYTAQTVTVDLQANLSWQVSLDQTWLTVQPTSGSGDGKLSLSFPAWDGKEDRSATLTIKAGELKQTLKVSQKAISCSLSESHIELPSTGDPYKVYLSSSVPWTIELPSDTPWLQVTPTSGPAAQDIIELICQAQPNGGQIRQTRVTVRCGIRTLDLTVIQQPLTVSEYTYTILQEHTRGTYPNEIIILGDGYSVADYAVNGCFNQDARDAMEAFFSIEPYNTYRSYFRVAKFVVYSPESGITELDKDRQVNTAFHVRFHEPSVISLDNPDKVFQTVMMHVPGMTKKRLQNTLLILLANIDRYGGVCWMYSDGAAIAICPASRTDSYYLYATLVDEIHHEAGGHGFGRLADEYVAYEAQALPEDATETLPYHHKKGLQQWKYYGFCPNIDAGGKKEEAPWAHYYTLPGYEAVDYYEGAYYFEWGAWRPEPYSCMVDNRPYYNAPSRENIVKLLLRRAAGVRLCEYVYNNDSGTFEWVPIPDDPFNMEDFIRNDVEKAWPESTLSGTRSGRFFIPTQPVRYVLGSPSY